MKGTINTSSIMKNCAHFALDGWEKNLYWKKKTSPISKAVIKICIKTCLDKLLLKTVSTSGGRRRML